MKRRQSATGSKITMVCDSTSSYNCLTHYCVAPVTPPPRRNPARDNAQAGPSKTRRKPLLSSSEDEGDPEITPRKKFCRKPVLSWEDAPHSEEDAVNASSTDIDDLRRKRGLHWTSFSEADFHQSRLHPPRQSRLRHSGGRQNSKDIELSVKSLHRELHGELSPTRRSRLGLLLTTSQPRTTRRRIPTEKPPLRITPVLSSTMRVSIPKRRKPPPISSPKAATSIVQSKATWLSSFSTLSTFISIRTFSLDFQTQTVCGHNLVAHEQTLS